MNTHADRKHENKSRSVSNEVSRKRSGDNFTFQFIDNRPVAAAHSKLQELAINSPQTRKLSKFQNIANRSQQINYSTQIKGVIQRQLIQQEDGTYFDTKTSLTVQFVSRGLYKDISSDNYYSYDARSESLVPHPYPFKSESASSMMLPSSPMPSARPQPSAPLPSARPQNNPWTSPGGRVRAHSPGGRTYLKGSPKGKRFQRPSKRQGYKRVTRRDAAGYNNPNHSHTNMLSHFRGAVVGSSNALKFARDSSDRAFRRNMDNLRYQGRDTHGNPTKIVPRNQAVLGHSVSAGRNWNEVGHMRSRRQNLEYNRQTKTYHGIEDRDSSDASGASEPRYNNPTPFRGSHPSYWNRSFEEFEGGPWPSWTLESTPSSSQQEMPPLALPPTVASMPVLPVWESEPLPPLFPELEEIPMDKTPG